MDYEKRYKEALERMKSWAKGEHPECFSEAQKTAEFIFPELKESEYERMKFLIKSCVYAADITPEGREEIFAWLEKQGEQKSSDFSDIRTWKYIVDMVLTEKDGIGNYLDNPDTERIAKKLQEKYGNIEKQGKEEYALKSFRDEDVDEFMQYIEKQAKAYEFNLPNRGYDIYAFAKDILHWLEKQDEKPTGKVEPKFKVGNWYQCTKDFFGKGVTFDKNTAYYCAKEGCLQNEYGCHIAIVKDLYDNFKLWTIEDAKAGDVLVDEDNNIGVYIEEKDDLYWYSRIYLGCDNRLRGFSIGAYHKHNNTKPATKEQRDLLFSKIKEAGYEWDADKKELKKIEVVSKESKDERVRKAILELVRQSSEILDKQNQNNMIAWLEKQGNKSVNIDVESMVSSYEQRLESQGGTKYTPLVNMCLTSFRHGVENVLEELNLKKLEKQGEQMTKPKFKVGDWITDGSLTCKVLGVTGKSYDLHLHNDDYCHFETDIQCVDKYYRLWTIHDAMDGDVLVSKDDHPFIFTGKFDVQDDNPTAYCGINSDDKFITGKGSHWTFKDGIKPATKEQCELLFSKMKEAGYEWDAEKKEVKKIEVASKD